MVLEFVAESVGESWVNLRWSVDEVRDDLDKYSILIDGDYTDNVSVSSTTNLELFI